MNNLNSKKKFTLISEDGIKFDISYSMIKNIGLFKNIIQLDESDCPKIFPVPSVSSLILDKIVEYLDNYVQDRLLNDSISNIKQSKEKTENYSSENDDNDSDFDSDDLIDKEREENDDSNVKNKLLNDNGDDQDDNDSEDFCSLDASDFSNLKILTPFEQTFFSSLDIPTLMELTKVISIFFLKKSILHHLLFIVHDRLLTFYLYLRF
jgi:hypothetical protein